MVYSMKAMAWCSPLSEIVATNIAGAKNLDTTGCPTKMARIVGGGEMPGAPDDDGRARSARATEDSTGGGASDGENSQMYYFGASTLTLGKIKEMVKRDILQRAKPERLWRKQFRSLTLTKPSCMRTFSLLVCACICIQLWLIFYYTFRRNYIS
jgi:hypothetical protein